MISTSRLSVRLPISPSAACAAVDAWIEERAALPRAAHVLRAGYRVWILPEFSWTSDGAALLRQTRGLVWHLCIPLRVRLEVSVWSSLEAELSIRPLAHWPSGSEKLGVRLHRTLAGMAVELIRHASEQPSDVTASCASHTITDGRDRLHPLEVLCRDRDQLPRLFPADGSGLPASTGALQQPRTHG